MAFSIIVAAGTQELQRGLAHIADIHGLDVELAGTAVDGTELRSLLFDLCPDIIIADLELPGDAVLDTVRLANQDGIECKFICKYSLRMSKKRKYEKNRKKLGNAEKIKIPSLFLFHF